MSIKSCWLVAVLSLAVSALAQAESVVTIVFNVYESKTSETLMVLSGVDGKIYKVKKQKDLLKHLNSMRGKIVSLSYVDNGSDLVMTNIRPVAIGEVDQMTMDLNHFQYNQLRTFAPTDLQSPETAQEVFDSMLNDGDLRRSQCFKRAHIWAFDMWSKLGIQSQKIFIFYASRFIMLEDKADWWFHVAPMVVVKGKEMVLDGTFMKTPISVEAWKSHFIRSTKVNCPLIENYSKMQEPNAQFKKLCYLMKTPMYHFSPLDIEARDLQGVKRNHWILEELQDARRAFEGYEETYEGLDTGKPTIKY
jgi:hypothetical protein